MRLFQLFFAPTSKLLTVSELKVGGASLMRKFAKSTPQAASGTGLLAPPGRKPFEYVA